jgi:hypothetical protein
LIVGMWTVCTFDQVFGRTISTANSFVGWVLLS